MTHSELLARVPLILLLLIAAAEDLHARRIPNWLTLGLILTGVLQSFTPNHTVLPGQSMLGLLCGFGLLLMLFAIGAVGGGDVKLLSGVGAWLGPAMVFHVFLIAAIAGMLIVLAQAACQRRLWTLFRNSAILTINILHMNDVGVDHVSRTGQSCRSVDRPLPYAVPVLLAVLAVVGGSLLGGRLQ